MHLVLKTDICIHDTYCISYKDRNINISDTYGATYEDRMTHVSYRFYACFEDRMTMCRYIFENSMPVYLIRLSCEDMVTHISDTYCASHSFFNRCIHLIWLNTSLNWKLYIFSINKELDVGMYVCRFSLLNTQIKIRKCIFNPYLKI